MSDLAKQIDETYAAANEDLNQFASTLAGLHVEHDSSLRACEVRVRVGSQLWARINEVLLRRRDIAPACDLDPEIQGD